MNRIGIIAIVALVAVAAPQVSHAATSSSTAPQAAVAKKKKKKHRKKRQQPAAPQAGGTLAPTQPADPPADPDVGWCAGEDAFEPDDDSAHALALPYPSSYEAVHERFRCPGDDDYFTVIVPARGFFVIDADPAEDFDLVVHSFGGASTSSDSGGAGVIEYLNIRNSGTAPIVVSIWVSGASETETGAYTLRGYET